MDLSLDKDLLVVRTDQGTFSVRGHLKTQDLLKDRVSMVYDSRRYRNYTSLWKKYGVDNMVYIPRINTQPPEDIPLENKLQTMSAQVQNNLARRYLRQNIDYIREISEDQAVTYVYDQKVLRLNKNGWLTYKDGQKNPDQEDSLVQSLDAALDFVTSHTGITESLYISDIERIQDKKNPGYIFILICWPTTRGSTGWTRLPTWPGWKSKDRIFTKWTSSIKSPWRQKWSKMWKLPRKSWGRKKSSIKIGLALTRDLSL
ncbi:conserved domain protein [Peptoniphilus sp. oral taxon 375 str. F0436]|nr:conserved domain protein [Peptoniphilus sp. oral taxon 375 str. F0436]